MTTTPSTPAPFLTDPSEAVEGESYVKPTYIETKLPKEKKLECRQMLKVLNEHGISQRQKLYLIYLMALELENREAMMTLTAAVGKCSDAVPVSAVDTSTAKTSLITTGTAAPKKTLITG